MGILSSKASIVRYHVEGKINTSLIDTEKSNSEMTRLSGNYRQTEYFNEEKNKNSNEYNTLILSH